MAKGPTEMVGPCLYGVLSCNTAPERSSVGFIRKYFVTSKLFKQSMATRFVYLPVLTGFPVFHWGHAVFFHEGPGEIGVVVKTTI